VKTASDDAVIGATDGEKAGDGTKKSGAGYPDAAFGEEAV
jgi:hypothetical protein